MYVLEADHTTSGQEPAVCGLWVGLGIWDGCTHIHVHARRLAVWERERVWKTGCGRRGEEAGCYEQRTEQMLWNSLLEGFITFNIQLYGLWASFCVLVQGPAHAKDRPGCVPKPSCQMTKALLQTQTLLVSVEI